MERRTASRLKLLVAGILASDTAQMFWGHTRAPRHGWSVAC